MIVVIIIMERDKDLLHAAQWMIRAKRRKSNTVAHSACILQDGKRKKEEELPCPFLRRDTDKRLILESRKFVSDTKADLLQGVENTNSHSVLTCTCNAGVIGSFMHPLETHAAFCNGPTTTIATSMPPQRQHQLMGPLALELPIFQNDAWIMKIHSKNGFYVTVGLAESSPPSQRPAMVWVQAWAAGCRWLGRDLGELGPSTMPQFLAYVPILDQQQRKNR